MTPAEYLALARVPDSVHDGTFGLWEILRVQPVGKQQKSAGCDQYTVLYRTTLGSLMHEDPGEIVMDDSYPELRQHLPIWLNAYGKVLITGLGLGCTLRGLLANDNVEQVDVIEIDRCLLDRIGPEFVSDPRVTLIHGDALKFPTNGSAWDFAWHDLWTDESNDEPHVQILHSQLFKHFYETVGRQGAWKFPRIIRQYMKRMGRGGCLIDR